MLSTYKLKIKSGVQDVSRHSEDPSILAITTMAGVNLVKISESYSISPLSTHLAGKDVRSISHFKDTLWVVAIWNKKELILIDLKNDKEISTLAYKAKSF